MDDIMHPTPPGQVLSWQPPPLRGQATLFGGLHLAKQSKGGREGKGLAELMEGISGLIKCVGSQSLVDSASLVFRVNEARAILPALLENKNMKNQNKANKGQDNKSAQSGNAGEQQIKVEKWIALEGPGLPTNIQKQGSEAGLPPALIALVSEAFKEAGSLQVEKPSGLWLARELWIEVVYQKLSAKLPKEKAEEVCKLVEQAFPAGKDYENAITWRDEVTSNFTEKAVNLLVHSCKASDFLIANGWGEDKGTLPLSYSARKLACNLAAVFGGLKKFYLWQADSQKWESIENLRACKESDGEEEKPKAKGKLDLSALDGVVL